MKTGIMNFIINNCKEIQRPVHFKNWTRKKYAIYNSLRKIIKICILSITYTILIPQKTSASQRDTIRINIKIDLEEVEVIGQRSPALYSEVSRIVTVITKNEIQSAPVQSAGDLLEYIAGLDNRQRGIFGIQSDINIRGGTFDQVMIMVNGINISDPQTGHFSLYLPVEIESIERIEILNGPAARVLGSNAFAGAINFVTGTKSSNNINASVNFGEYGFSRLNTSGTILTKTTKNFLSVSKTKSNGYIDFTAFDRYNLFYHGELEYDNIDVSYQIGYDNRDFEANSYYSSKYPEQYEIVKTTFAAIKANTGNKIKISPSIYWRRLNDYLQMVIDSSYTFHIYNLIDIFGANVNFIIPTKFGNTSLGFEYRTENIYSNNRGFDMTRPIIMPGYKNVLLDKSYVRSNAGYFLEHNMQLGNLYFSTGLMLNWNSTFRNKIKVFPGIDISYNILHGFKVYSSINQAFRLPTFTDLFYDDPVQYGNIELKPEKATTLETGLKLNTPEILGYFAFYHRIGKNNIDWVWDADTNKWHTENIAEISANGIDFSIVFNFNEIFSPDFFIKNLNFSYSFVDIIKSTGEFESKYALDNLKHKLTITSVIRITKNTEASIYTVYQNRAGNYDVYDANSDSSLLFPYKPFWLISAKLQRNISSLNVFVEANNILNITYRDISSVIQPGRWIIAGFKINLDFPLKSKSLK